MLMGVSGVCAVVGVVVVLGLRFFYFWDWLNKSMVF